MNDLIYRQMAIDAVHEEFDECLVWDESGRRTADEFETIINQLPSAQPEVKPISYADCANALMMMWIDKVLTDGEYKKIMDRLNAHEMKKREREEDE